jgi:predicted aminopeptidase
MKKKIFYLVTVFVLGSALIFHKEIYYGLSLAKGQLRIVLNAKPIDEVLASGKLNEEQCRKLRLVSDAKRFAIAKLSIRNNGNYEAYYEQNGRPLMVVVTACDPYSFREKTWHFPFLGDLSYKGFFTYADAREEATKQAMKGYDVGIGKVSGWSTLGWLRDPVLSSMLEKSDGRLVSLIIHEMLHGTVYMGKDVDFSENLADFVGFEGAKLYFQEKKLRKELTEFEAEMKAEKRMNDYFLKSKNRLEIGYSLYKGDKLKLKQFKKQCFRKIYQGVFFQPLTSKERPKYIRSAKYLYLEGNDYLMGFSRYGKLQDSLNNELKNQFGGDLKKMIEHFSKGDVVEK